MIKAKLPRLLSFQANQPQRPKRTGSQVESWRRKISYLLTAVLLISLATSSGLYITLQGNVDNAWAASYSSITFNGSGANDMSLGGTFNGSVQTDYKVQIDGGGKNGSFTSVAQDPNPPYLAVLTSTGHGLSGGEQLVITNSTYYNGTWPVMSVTANTITIGYPYQNNDTGNWVIIDTFRWSDDGGSTWDGSGLNIPPGGWIPLNNGVQISFAANTGHILNDYWTFSAYTYAPRLNNWRWYGDEANATPTTAYAAENTAPPTAEMGLAIPLKLRLNLTEVGGEAENNNRKVLVYGTGGAWTAVGGTDATNTAFKYADCAGTDNATLASVVLSDSSSSSKGIHNESNSAGPSNSDHPANTTVEFEYCIENYNASAGTTYFFSVTDETVGQISLASGKSYPSLTTASAYDLSIEGAPADIALGNYALGDSLPYVYNFTSGEKITIRDNRGTVSGNSSGWSLTVVSSAISDLVAGSLGSINFTGSGNNDMSHNNTYTGMSATTYTVTVTDTMPVPLDVVQWNDGLGQSGGCGTNAACAMSNGVVTTWGAAKGHVLNDVWTFTATPQTTYAINPSDVEWIADSITGLYAASTTGITTQSGAYFTGGSPVTSATVSGSGRQGLGGFTQQPTMHIDDIPLHVGDYNGSLTLTLT